MSLDDWKRVTDSLVRYREETKSSPSVMLWGGEPLVSPDFLSVVRLLRRNGFELGIVTNGVLIDKYADVLKSEFKKIYVSIDGTREIHDSIRGEGVFDKVCSNIELISGTKAQLVIMSVLSPALADILPEFPYTLESLRPSELLIQEMIYMTEAETDAYCRWLKNCFNICASEIYSWQTDVPAGFEQKKRMALGEMKKRSYPFKVRYMPHGSAAAREYCLAPFRHLHVAWNGNVLYCTDFYDFCAGNVKEEDIIDIFNNPASERYRKEIVAGSCPTCNHCSWRNNSEFSL